jgi:hypothetical protein
LNEQIQKIILNSCVDINDVLVEEVIEYFNDERFLFFVLVEVEQQVMKEVSLV